MDADVAIDAITLLAGGVHHNLKVEAKIDGKPAIFVIRRMPPLSTFGFHRTEVAPYSLATEFAVLRDLEGAPLRTPRVRGCDGDGAFLGTPAFLMEYIAGPTVAEAIAAAPQTILPRFVEAIATMNAIPASLVPSIVARYGEPSPSPPDIAEWLTSQIRDMPAPPIVGQGLAVVCRSVPDHRPAPCFGNGDLNPLNFIVTGDGEIAIVDWEYAGFNDPLLEIMLLHDWPPESPLLNRYPLDQLYCEHAGTDRALLPWYELCGTLSSWIAAVRDGNDALLLHCEQRIADNIAALGA
jgi:aminoglycoside phosphotransferase (APT) family kinase protein